MKRCALLCVLIMPAVFPQVSEAGTFVVDRVWFANGPESNTRLNRRVGSSAIYQGTVDIGDNQWQIQATLIVGGTPYHGSPKVGNSIHASQRITCPDNSCGGAHEFDRCPQKFYTGYGIAAIYHQFTPETSRDDLPTFNSGCQQEEPESPTSGPVVQGCAPECGSPIVIDLDRGGFRFTDLAGGVSFDLDGDGAAEALSWIEPGSGDGWLALDRNGDGVIDNGSELFGNFTPQPPTGAPHGYHALAVFDTVAEGGDGDGAITAADHIFDALRLWVDGNSDGVSQPVELVPLAAAGVHSIYLDYVESRRRDQHGNELRYSGRVWVAGDTARSADVFLLVAP